ncbi:MAG: hypothetical protein KDD64_16905, partial [Bdellovibrionales bacterium]|nr:hypothetical protein [Bdellovibrionales bacterium]
FLLTLVGVYLFTNLLFALFYYLCGPESLTGFAPGGNFSFFLNCFFFSVQTFATIGYGTMHPMTVTSNLLVTVESILGLLEFGVLTGIIFARFSRPQAKLLFSDYAVVAPFHGLPSLQFRLVNIRKSDLVQPSVRVLFSRLVGSAGEERREYSSLKLYLEQVLFLPLYWTVTHLIDDTSPLKGLRREDLERGQAEILIQFTAVDELFSEQINLRHSYRFNEVIFDARFDPLSVPSESGIATIDVRKISSYSLLPSGVGSDEQVESFELEASTPDSNGDSVRH